MKERKLILHLCADIGSDSRYYQIDDNYDVVMVGEEWGVENFRVNTGRKVHGIIANPVCTEFSTVKTHGTNDLEKGMFLVNHCMRIIEETNPVWWVLENPATGKLRDILGKPNHIYQPWEYGQPWTKKTALWGNFNMPKPLFSKWEDVPKREGLYIRPGRGKPSLVVFHKSAIDMMPEYRWCRSRIKTDADIRSLCSDGFAREFKKINE